MLNTIQDLLCKKLKTLLDCNILLKISRMFSQLEGDKGRVKDAFSETQDSQNCNIILQKLLVKKKEIKYRVEVSA